MSPTAVGRVFASTALFATLGQTPGVAGAAPGDPDATFGNGGQVITALGNTAAAMAIALQPDGKAVVAGYAKVASNFDIAVIRYLQDGSLDPSFGGDGVVTTPVGPSDDYARALAIQPDGKIVVAGYTQVGASLDFAIVRYEPEGILDATFGGDGIVVTSIAVLNDFARAVAIQPDGKIVVAGYTSSGDDDFVIARYLADGTLDPGFSGDGIMRTAIGVAEDEAYAVAIQADGRIVAAGRSFSDQRGKFTVVRVTSDGTLDTTFDGDGKVATRIGTGHTFASAVAIQPDGKIVAAGHAWFDGHRIAVARYDVDGSLDATFDGDGIATTSIVYSDVATAVAIHPLGRIVVAAKSATGTSDRFAVVQYKLDGSLDPGFGDGGIVTTALRGFEDDAYALSIQPDGKPVLAGVTRASSPIEYAIALARYEGTVSVCGDGVTEGGEGCDDGNRSDGDCCSSVCAIEPAATVCRAAAAPCDLIELCDGVSPSCPPDRSDADSDADGRCDADDPCIAGGSIEKPSLRLSNFATGPGDDRLTLKGRATLGDVDPVSHGLRVVVEDAASRTLVDAVIPPGGYSAATRRGWKANARGSSYRFVSAAPVGGAIDRVVLSRRSAADDRLRISIRGKGGGFALPPVAPPMRIALDFEPSSPAPGSCAEATFAGPRPAPTCVWHVSGGLVACR